MSAPGVFADHDDGQPWGYLDSTGAWRQLPKVPLLLAHMGPPPFDVKLPDGRVRRIIHDPGAKQYE